MQLCEKEYDVGTRADGSMTLTKFFFSLLERNVTVWRICFIYRLSRLTVLQEPHTGNCAPANSHITTPFTSFSI